ncbi:C4-dicarboxylate ABC transporter substrate-binding protein [Rhodococcus rhodochrous]|uniref:C4-dicarboxylate ABC transporter substrate-binding protein n=1 Tax=Rhodococcus rhodochrous TaxID=1829 RepID=UPI001D02BE7E|nr:C4-dicarboxylate ABC transporter substrate-binding protein [Rhodococcus rhodochrous]
MAISRTTRWKSLGGTTAALTLVATLVAGCADSGASGTGTGSSDGVDYGATEEDYIAAFEDVEPIRLFTQSPAPKGSATGVPVEKYLDTITEWSGGKITFDVAYSNAVAPPAEIDNALMDGRLDLAHIIPQYEPSEYPATTALIDSSFASLQTPLQGALQSNAWANQVAFDTPELLSEYSDKGMKLLLPMYNSGANGLFCATERRDLAATRGAQVTASGLSINAEVAALGATPVSIAYTELFEALERGIADCSVTSFTVGMLGGFLGQTPYAVIDPEVGLAVGWGGIAMSEQAWDSLPLVAQQLMWDSLTVYLESNIEDKILPNTVDGMNALLESGGNVFPYEEDAREALRTENRRLLDAQRSNGAFEDGDAFVGRIESSTADWAATVDELGYERTTYEEFARTYEPGAIDLADYSAKVYEEIFLPHRPS